MTTSRAGLVLSLLLAASAASPAAARSRPRIVRSFVPAGLIHEPAQRRVLLFGQVWAQDPSAGSGQEGDDPPVWFERLEIVEVAEDGTSPRELPGVFVGLDLRDDPPLFEVRRRPKPWTEKQSSPLWLVDPLHQRVLVLTGSRAEQRREWSAHVRGEVALDEVLDPGRHPEHGYAVELEGGDARVTRRTAPVPGGVAEDPLGRATWSADGVRDRLVRVPAVPMHEGGFSPEELLGPRPIAPSPSRPPWCSFRRPEVLHMFGSPDGGVWIVPYWQYLIRLSAEGTLQARFWVANIGQPRPAPAPVTAIVYRGSARTVEEAEAALQRWQAASSGLSGLARAPAGYPKVIASHSLPGMRPGYEAVVLGFCPPDRAARLLARLRKVDPEIYGRVVVGPDAACPGGD